MGSTDPLVGLLPLVAAILAAATCRRYPVVAFGILFLTASLSRATFETPLGTMRPEMPAVAVVGLILLATRGVRDVFTVPRDIRLPAFLFLLYLGAIALSSILVAPDRRQSLLMVAWLSTSMASGLIALVLLRRRPRDSPAPFALAGAVMGALGISAAVVFLVSGPSIAPGIQDPETVLPRVYGLAWETNLYASFLAICAFFALELARRSPSRWSYAALALIAVGFPLGITRGAYIGLFTGAAAFVLVFAFRETHRLRRLFPVAIATTTLLVVGLACTVVLLPGAGRRMEDQGVAATRPTPTPLLAPGGSEPPQSSAHPSTSSRPASNPAPTPTPSPEPMPDTLGFRLERVPIALAELPQSPLIGFGAESFGQRHPERYAGSGPDHIAIMAVVVPYESGVLGTVGLALGFVALLRLLWRRGLAAASAGDLTGIGLAAAFVASLVAMLVAYQVTNSIHMAVNWMIIGAAAAFCSEDAPGLATTDGQTSAQRKD